MHPTQQIILQSRFFISFGAICSLKSYTTSPKSNLQTIADALRSHQHCSLNMLIGDKSFQEIPCTPCNKSVYNHIFFISFGAICSLNNYYNIPKSNLQHKNEVYFFHSAMHCQTRRCIQNSEICAFNAQMGSNGF